jgi:hypothetical protein
MKPASLLLAAFTITLLTAWSSCQDKKPAAKPAVIEEYDVDRDSVLVILGTVNGKPGRFLVDTGMTLNALDVAHLAAPVVGGVTIHSSGGPRTFNLYQSPDFRAADHAVQDSDRIVGMDLQPFHAFVGKLDGILGMAFLRNHVLQVDFDRGKLRFLTAVPDDAGTGHTLYYDAWGMPHIGVALTAGIEEPFLLDTGHEGPEHGNLRQDLFRRLEWTGSLEIVHSVTSYTIAGSVDRDVGRLRLLEIGSVVIADPTFLDSPTSVLGLGFLSRFQVTFDFPNGMVYLKEGRRFDEPA